MKRLLILSCSQSKRTEPQSLPAYERYDGPSYRLLRRYLRTSTETPTIRILSAEYGLIPHDSHIPFYDRKMTARRAQDLQPQVTKALDHLFNDDDRKTRLGVFILLGKIYLGALDPSSIFSSRCSVRIASGTPGKKLSDLYSWLYGESAPPGPELITKESNNNVHIRGITISCAKERALNEARWAITKRVEDRSIHHSWYVLIDNTRVSPKWLVSVLTGLPVCAFHSDEARRVLSELGIEVLRA
jgi:hypothetical protein